MLSDDLSEEPTLEQMDHLLHYLKNARQDPPPWEENGPNTALMAPLTPAVLAEMDRERVEAPSVREEPVQSPPTRMEQRRARRRCRRRHLMRLGAVTAGVLLVSLLISAGMLR